MVSARALLDTYAGSTVYLPGHGEFSADTLTPASFAALYAVLDLHEPGVIKGVVMSDGTCAACRFGAPVHATTSPANQRTVHEHADPLPFCGECTSGKDYEPSSVPWPCPTVRAIISALETA